MAELKTLGVTVEQIDRKTSKNGKEYARVNAGKKWFSVFDTDVMQSLVVGNIYRVKAEFGEFNGKPSNKIHAAALMDDEGNLGEWVGREPKGASSSGAAPAAVAQVQRHFKSSAPAPSVSSTTPGRESEDERATRIARAVALKAALDLRDEDATVSIASLINTAEEFMPYLLKGTLPKEEAVADEVPFE